MKLQENRFAALHTHVHHLPIRALEFSYPSFFRERACMRAGASMREFFLKPRFPRTDKLATKMGDESASAPDTRRSEDDRGLIGRSTKFLGGIGLLLGAGTGVVYGVGKFATAVSTAEPEVRALRSLSPTVAESATPGATATAAPCGAADAKAAMDDSNACYVAYQNGQIAQAEAVCNQGLAKAKCAKASDAEGMLYFNLGLCAENRADWQSAKHLYESSLQARPGNASVEERLNAVTLRLAANR